LSSCNNKEVYDQELIIRGTLYKIRLKNKQISIGRKWGVNMGRKGQEKRRED